MRRLVFLAVAAVTLWLATGTLTTHAQSIEGVSFRATAAMPAGTDRGSADIRADGDGFLVTADFSRVSSSLVLDDFDGASAWVVWAIDMSGAEHNIGALNDDLVLENARVTFMPAGLVMSAEDSSANDARRGDALFEVRIRQVQQADQPTATAAAAEAAPTATPPAAATDEPRELPTTGQLVRDLLVLAAAAVVLLLGGLQLRRVRF